MRVCKLLFCVAAIVSVTFSFADAYATIPPSNPRADTHYSPSASRRKFFDVAATMIVSSAAPAFALDIDSFVQKELDNETCNDKTNKKCKAKLSEDEALCRFGQPSTQTGEACVRASMSTKRPSGVDAFGSVDRGNFVKCKPNYVDDPERPGMLVNVWKCE